MMGIEDLKRVQLAAAYQVSHILVYTCLTSTRPATSPLTCLELDFPLFVIIRLMPRMESWRQHYIYCFARNILTP